MLLQGVGVLGYLFNKVVGLRSATLLKRNSQYMCFPVTYTKFLDDLYFLLLIPILNDSICCLLVALVNIANFSFTCKVLYMKK